MVEDMDEAAAYGSPVYRLLHDAINAEPSDSEESEMSDTAGGGRTPDIVEAETATEQLPTLEAVSSERVEEGGPTSGEAGTSVDFGSAWELYRGGEMGAGGVLALLTRIHGEALGASWPMIVSALPSGEVSLSHKYT